MSGFKRDWSGNAKRRDGPKSAPKQVVRNAYTPMFESLRDELDEHHDRRERIVKASRDITALSKKIIFSLQRVRKIENRLPANIQSEVDSRLAEISKLLASIAPEIQGINRYRYSRSLMCLEELVEALTFAHYLRTQTLISYAELDPVVQDLTRKGATSEDQVMADASDTAGSTTTTTEIPPSSTIEPPTFSLTQEDYLYGVFDLTGEMMRFATTSTALTGTMAGGQTENGGSDGEDDEPRTIVQDMHELGTFFEMLPVAPGNRFQWDKKLEVTRQSVQKVERLGYDRIIRGSERPKGWVPDLSSGDQGQGDEVE
ncbi:Translin family-domain-containing protein [Corynascus novoguineensis]|uniref:Translin family-domain-containing protein n=1 Tax=Corynascus novoguineensis TaxID=1126955 RepID=A0AAN7HME2_9PEZI|nr:Translin family-domain-containing protein [Corynascus novoguineensis]